MTTVIEFYIPDNTRKDALTILDKYFDKSVCKTIEKGFYNFTSEYCTSCNCGLGMARSIYVDSIDNFRFNCEQNHNTIRKLKKLIKQKIFNPYNLAFLRPDELDEDIWAKIILRKINTEEKLNNLPTIEWKPCRQCNNKLYFYYQLQTRSADEPMTTFYICKDCNKTYKVNN